MQSSRIVGPSVAYWDRLMSPMLVQALLRLPRLGFYSGGDGVAQTLTLQIRCQTTCSAFLTGCFSSLAIACASQHVFVLRPCKSEAYAACLLLMCTFRLQLTKYSFATATHCGKSQFIPRFYSNMPQPFAGTLPCDAPHDDHGVDGTVVIPAATSGGKALGLMSTL